MPSCSCIRGNEGYLFHVDQKACDFFIYADLSDWMEESYYVVPTSYNIEVKVPSSSSFVSLQVNTSGYNKITATDLKVGGNCLPDGVYCIKTEEICGITYTSFFALTYKLECCLAQLLLQADSPEDWSKLKTYHLRIEQIKEAARQGNSKLATDLYVFVRRLLSREKCNC